MGRHTPKAVEQAGRQAGRQSGSMAHTQGAVYCRCGATVFVFVWLSLDVIFVEVLCAYSGTAMNFAKQMYLLDNTALKFSLAEGSNRKWWVHPINEERDTFGEYHHLIPQLRNDPTKFKEYFRMLPETFDYILEKVSPLIMKNTTNYRPSISPEERLSVTLR